MFPEDLYQRWKADGDLRNSGLEAKQDDTSSASTQVSDLWVVPGTRRANSDR